MLFADPFGDQGCLCICAMGRKLPQDLVKAYAEAFAEQQRLKEVAGIKHQHVLFWIVVHTVL